MRDLLSYFEDNWIGQPTDAIFPVSLWNVYTAAHQDLPKTNNAVERYVAQKFFADEWILSSIDLNFIEALKKEESLNEFKLR